MPSSILLVNPQDQHLLISFRKCKVEGREGVKPESGGKRVGVAGATNKVEEISRDESVKIQETRRKSQMAWTKGSIKVWLQKKLKLKAIILKDIIKGFE